MQNHYAVLGLRDDADEVVIAAAFRSLSKKFHPDTSGSLNNSDVEKFRKIKDAYEVLRDPEKRKRFDEQLSKARARSSKAKTKETRSTRRQQSDSTKQSGKADDAKTTGQASESTSGQAKNQRRQSKSHRWVWGAAIAGGFGALLLMTNIIKLSPERSDGPDIAVGPEPIVATPAVAPKIAAVTSENKGDLDPLDPLQYKTEKVVTERSPAEPEPVIRDAITAKPTVAPQIEAVTSENKGNLLEATQDTTSKVITDRLPVEPQAKSEIPDAIVGNAAEKGDPSLIAEQGISNTLPAQNQNLTAALIDAEDPNKYRSAANKGDVGAMVALGLMARDGTGMKRDYSEAFKMFKLAADKGDTDAAYWLAAMYNNGQGTGLDFTQAIRLYAMAALRGHKAAAARLRVGTGFALSSGIDVNGKTYSQALDDFHRSMGGKEVTGGLNSMFTVAAEAADANAAPTNSNHAKLSASSKSNDTVTGGGEVKLIAAEAFERNSKGKLEGCEIAYKLAFRDNINREGKVTILDGSFSILLAGQGKQSNLHFVLKTMAEDVIGDQTQFAPLDYAYISTKNRSYARTEFKTFSCADGSICKIYNAIQYPELPSVITSGIEVGITRKDSSTDINIPVNFSRDATATAAKLADCTSALANRAVNKLDQ